MPNRILAVIAWMLSCLALAATEEARAQRSVLDVDGVTLPYDVRGSGTPLVLIHGWAVNSGFWDGDVERLAREHTVITYDRRGFGEAGGSPDLTADPADLAALLDRLGHDRAHLLGHSQGALVALTFAARRPDRVASLILYGPPPPSGLDLPMGEDTPPMAEWVTAGKTHGVDSVRVAILRWAREWGGVPAGAEQRGRELLATYDAADLLDPSPPSNLVQPAGVDELTDVEAPTLVLLGEREMPQLQIAADVLAYGIPDAHKVVIPGGGHVVSWSEPERFAQEVLTFLSHVDDAPTRRRNG